MGTQRIMGTFMKQLVALIEKHFTETGFILPGHCETCTCQAVHARQLLSDPCKIELTFARGIVLAWVVEDPNDPQLPTDSQLAEMVKQYQGMRYMLGMADMRNQMDMEGR